MRHKTDLSLSYARELVASLEAQERTLLPNGPMRAEWLHVHKNLKRARLLLKDAEQEAADMEENLIEKDRMKEEYDRDLAATLAKMSPENQRNLLDMLKNMPRLMRARRKK